MNRMVSAKLAVINVLEDIGMEEYNQAPIVRRWCLDAAREISGKYDFKIRRIVKPLQNKREIDIPEETYNVLNVFTGIVGQECNVSWSDSLYPNLSSFDPTFTYNNMDFGNSLSVLYGTDMSTASSSLGNYSIVNNQIVFDCDLDNINEMTIYVAVYQIDSQGFVMVSENHLIALSYYVKMMVAERSRFGASPMPMNDVANFRRRWTQQKKKAQIRSNKMPPHEREMLSSIINNPLSGKVIDYHGDFSKFIH